MPVYLFALSQVQQPDWWRALLIFFILHVLVYPASNGYNSYMDRDEGSIGGIKVPMQPTRQLFNVSVVMDILSVFLGFLISVYFAIAVMLYILASRAYSYRGIRLKKYPLAGYITVVFFQGAVTFWMVYHGCHPLKTLKISETGMLASSLLIGGFYPLTQIYQHESDRKDGVVTISALIGYRGTFVFCGMVYSCAFMVLAYHYISSLEFKQFLVLQIFMLPVLVFFFAWGAKVFKNAQAADFGNTMKMNVLASWCTNTAFITLIIWRIFE